MNVWLKLFDTSDFPARWYCGEWTPRHGWLHILSDLGVWSAYFAIPCILGYFIARRKDLPFRSIFFLFAAFILACGTTHLMEATIFWWPAYRLAGLIKLLTALVSWTTVVALVPVVPKVLAMRSPEELEREIRARNRAEQDLQHANQELERRIAARTAELLAANATLWQQREWFRTTLASIGDAVIVTDAGGKIDFVNPVAESLTGWALDDARGQPLDTVFQLLNETSRQSVKSPAARTLREGRIVGLANHTLLIAKDGTQRPIDDSAAPIRNDSGEVIGCVLVFRDISERKAAESQVAAERERLRESEGRFRTLAESIPQLAWSAHPDGYIHWYNRRWYDYTGATPEQMAGWGWQSVHDPAVLPEVLERWKASIATGQPFDMVFPLRGADGRFRPFLTRVLPLKDQSGRVIQWFGTNTDISEQRAMEEALRDADRRKNEFLATLAHELRNPLAPIRTGLEAMKLAGGLSEPLEIVRGTMERQTQQLIALVDDLLDVSRITRGKLELRKCRVELAQVVQSAVEAAGPFVQEAGHSLSITLPPQPIFLDADPHRLAQVVSNLLNNAAKYTPEGGHIGLSAERQGSDVLISVSDTGIGVPAEMQAHIFDMFAQIDRPLEKGYVGLGIGLTLVKSLVEMHGGSVNVQSDDGPHTGTTFHIRLPAVLTATGPDPQPLPSAEFGSSGKRRVLIVDDNKAAADMLRMLVKALGNEVRTARDGAEAITVAQEFRPEIVLMDIGMPKLNGYDAARQIRQHPWGQEMILIALTGWGQEEDKQRTREAGFDYHLVKPAEPAVLQKLLSEARRQLQSDKK